MMGESGCEECERAYENMLSKCDSQIANLEQIINDLQGDVKFLLNLIRSEVVKNAGKRD